MNRPKDPYRNYRFTVSLGNIKVAGFSEVTIPDTTTDAIDYREGTDAPDLTRKLSGLTKYGDLVLKNGVTATMDLYKWKSQVEQQGAGSPQARKTLGITLIDDQGKETAKWSVENAWPTKYETSGLSAEGKEVLIQTLTITHEGIARKA